MDANEKKARLNENLSKAMALNNLARSKEYTKSLLPYLKKLAQVPYVDPTRFKTEDEFLYVLRSANARAGAYSELLMFLSQQEAVMRKIREEIEKPPKSHGI
jgi:hypothetical protein